jgi:hypothetical protein
MRYNSSNPREKLIPLRRFAADNLYSAKYLSLLVQRKKLKASKVGRNFYTTEKWFFEYLEKHARDEVRLKYKELFARANRWQTADGRRQKNTPLNPPSLRLRSGQARGDQLVLPGEIELSQVSVPVESGAMIWLKNHIYKLSTAVFAVFFVALLVSQIMIRQDVRQGVISGVEEVNIDVGTSTEDILIDDGAVRFGE